MTTTTTTTTRTTSRLLVALATIAVIAVPLTIVATPESKPSVAASPAQFDPLANATSVGPAAFGQVVTDGDGTFLSVHRLELPGGQYIGVRRSTDGGRTWTTVALLDGTNGAATRPVIALSGSYASVAYLGGWCLPASPTSCSEAPYLTVSSDRGASWSEPRRLDQQALRVRVAQDGTRTWVAWERYPSGGATVEVRGTRDGAATWFVTRSLPGRGVELAADGGRAVVAYTADANGTPSAMALVARGDQLATTAAPLADPFGDAIVRPIGAAVADGRIHVMASSQPVGTFSTFKRSIDVYTAGDDGVFDTVHSFGESVLSASIAAEHGTVAVALGEVGGITSVATSGDRGTTFSDPVPVHATGENGLAPYVHVGVTTRPPDRPIARFSWSVADRLVDDDGDGFPDPANDSGDPSLDALRVYAGRTMELTLDGCDSTVPAGRTVKSYRWTEILPNGTTSVLPSGSCKLTFSVDSGDSLKIRFDVTDSADDRASTVQTVEPRDLVVVSLGDSVASGEGNPHVPVGVGEPAVWQDRACHRSMTAGPALAARRLEASDPHTSVTFIQLACSGAAIVDSPEVPGVDDPATGGVLDAYQGQEPQLDSLRPSQVEQLEELLGIRPVDALMLSIGANDTKFSETLLLCMILPRCDLSFVRTEFEGRLATLPDRFARLATALTDLGVAAEDVHITEYFDPTVDELGVIQLRCVTDGLVDDLIDDDEARWAASGVTGGLNLALSAAAGTHGWRYVGGIVKEFERHGYCSTDPYLAGIAESVLTQGNKDGAFHPNAAGHEVYGDALYGSLRGALLLPAPAGPQDGTGTGSEALGEIMVTSTSSSAITVTALRDTGGAPALLGSRVIDRMVSGNGSLGMAGPPAVGPAAAVGVWTQFPEAWSTRAEEWAAQLAVSPNLAVNAVHVVQAPTNEQYLIAGRKTVVLADIEATIEGPVDAQVYVNVSASTPSDPGAPPRSIVPGVTATVRLQPGMNHVILPEDQTFTLQPGEVPIAQVTVTDPTGADPAADLDNELIDDPVGDGRARSTVEGRPLTIGFTTPKLPSGAQVRCRDLSEIARRQLAFARAAIPVAEPGISSELACGFFPSIDQATEAGVLAYLNDLDWFARYALYDVLVAVVPGGWLQTAAGGAVGAASPGGRAVIIEQSAPSFTLAHEVAHSFGVSDHVPTPSKVAGVRVDQRRYLHVPDWMIARTPDKAWTGAGTWDFLAEAFGTPNNAPVPPDPESDQLGISGTVDNAGNHRPGPWTPGDTRSSRDLDLGELQLERMLVEQVDGTTVLASEPVPLSPVEGLYAPGAEPAGPVGWTYGTNISLRPDATSVRLVLDGVVVDERPVTGVPDVTVTAPTADVVVARGEQLNVEWTTTAGPSSTAAVFVSQNGGDTWKPLALGLTGTSAEVTISPDMVDGSAVVRVVVNDGVRAGRGDSAEFTVRAPVTLLPEQVVAVRHDLVDLTVPGATFPTYPGNGLWTMNTDGTDFREIVPLVPPVDGQGGMVPLHPDWRGDGEVIAFDGGSWTVGGRRDLYVVARDGSGLRQVTNASSDGGRQFVCADWHPDGRQILSLAGESLDGRARLQLVSVDSESGAVTPLRDEVQGFSWYVGGLGYSVLERACPRWSDDGNEILLSVETQGPTSQINYVHVIDVATLQSKYAYSVNSGALTFGGHTTWLDFAPGDGDRFLATSREFGIGRLHVAEPTPVFIVDQVVPIPNTIWGTSTVDPPIVPAPNEMGVNAPLFGSAGFDEDGTTIWFTSINDLAPTRFQQLTQDSLGRFYDTIYTEPVGHFCRMPIGQTPAAGTCYAPGGDGTPVDEVAVTRVNLPALPPEAPTVGIIQADVHPGITRTEEQPPIVIEDPGTLPPDPEDPPPGDVTTPLPEQSPAPGADDVPPGPVPAAAATTVTVVAGEPTVFVVRTPDGAPTIATIVGPPSADTIEVRPASPAAGDPTTTDPDGEIVITPLAGFVGRTTFPVTTPGSDAIVLITVDVVPPPAPVAVPDTLTIAVGSPTIVDPAELLANDRPAESTQEARSTGDLRVVSVYGFTGGTAVLDRDGLIEVLLDQPTGGTFSYVIADETGATSTAEVTVLATQVPTTTATPTTTSPTTTAAPPTTTATPPTTTAAPPTTSPSSTSPTTTTSAPPTPSTTTPSGTVAPAPPTTPTSISPISGELPSTGSSPWHAVRVALTLVAFGVALAGVAWTTRRRRTVG